MVGPAVIDSLEFARSGQQVQGAIAVAQLTRLADSLFDARGDLNFTLSGGYDAERRPRLNLKVEGDINLKCQRCLGSLAFPVAVGSSLLVLTGGAGGETAEIEDLDGIPADPHTDVWALIEDEVLLAIPIAPRHAEGQCSAAVTTTREHGVSPFAALAKLRQDRIRN